MSLQVEQLEHNMAKLTIEVSAEELEGALQKAYQKQKGRINVPGFRKGHAPENLVRQKIQLETGMFFIISLDVENYKDKKISRLERLAKQTAREVKRTHIDVHLENMNSYERRIIHNALSEFKGISTKSTGEEPNRHIVISYIGEK